MKKLKSLNIGQLAKIAAVNGLILGLLFGIFGVIALSIGESMMNDTMDTVMSYSKAKPEYEPNVNQMMATMIAGIARYVAEEEKLQSKDKKTFDKLFPEDELAKGNMTKTLNEVAKLVKPEISDIIGTFQLLMIIGLPLGMAVFSYFIGLLVGFIYNKMNGIEVDIQ
ncbi:MAG: hypothetical protein OEZ36_06575 [Spirochaetota bacterium]|nr:hypothetical protein [Spirochaetota bacterium]